MSENHSVSPFRAKTLERISSPEQLTDYLRVTSPGIWIVLAAVICLLAGLLAWSTVGTLETRAEATVLVEDHTARVVTKGSQELKAGMPLRIVSQDFVISATETDSYGRLVGILEVTLPDGTYEGSVVVDQTRPIDFLLEGR